MVVLRSYSGASLAKQREPSPGAEAYPCPPTLSPSVALPFPAPDLPLKQQQQPWLRIHMHCNHHITIRLHNPASSAHLVILWVPHPVLPRG